MKHFFAIILLIVKLFFFKFIEVNKASGYSLHNFLLILKSVKIDHFEFFNLERPTHNRSCGKQSDRKSISTYINVCPCDLLIVIA